MNYYLELQEGPHIVSARRVQDVYERWTTLFVWLIVGVVCWLSWVTWFIFCEVKRALFCWQAAADSPSKIATVSASAQSEVYSVTLVFYAHRLFETDFCWQI